MPLVARQWIAKHRKPGFLPRLQVDYIRFRNLRFYQHSAHICQRQNVRCLLCGNHRLALQSGDLRHFPAHRGNDTGVIEIGFSRIERGLIALDLRVNGANLRLFHSHLRRGGIEILQ
ncbi:Uncharacterised protein [Shigella flexneri]|nr:Uncharacterised protein [Shigella flexneri]